MLSHATNEQLIRIWNNCVTAVGDHTQVQPLPYTPTEEQVIELLGSKVSLIDRNITCAEAYTDRAGKLHNSYRSPEATQMHLDMRAVGQEQRMAKANMHFFLETILPETIALFANYPEAQSLLENLFYNYNGLPLGCESQELIKATIEVAKEEIISHDHPLSNVIPILLHYASPVFREKFLTELLENFTSFHHDVKVFTLWNFFKEIRTGSPRQLQVVFKRLKIECIKDLMGTGHIEDLLNALATALSSPISVNTTKSFCKENSEAINQLIKKLQRNLNQKINPDVKAYLQAFHGDKADVQSILQELFAQTPQ